MNPSKFSLGETVTHQLGVTGKVIAIHTQLNASTMYRIQYLSNGEIKEIWCHETEFTSIVE